MIHYTPLALLSALGLWAVVVVLPHLSEGLSALVLGAVGASIVLGVIGCLRSAGWTDTASLVFLGGGFVTGGVFVARLNVVQLYLFVALIILTFQLTRFRTITAPLRLQPSLDEATFRGLKSTFMSTLARGVLGGSLVFLVSIALFMTGTILVLGLAADVTAFLLALVILIVLVVIAMYPARPSV